MKNKNLNTLLKFALAYYDMPRYRFNYLRGSNPKEVKNIMRLYYLLLNMVGFTYSDIANITGDNYKQISEGARGLRYRTYNNKKLKKDIADIIEKYKGTF